MANTLRTPDWVVKEVSRSALNNITFGKNVTRKLPEEFKVAGTKIGSQFSMRLPWQPTVTKGQAFQEQNIDDRLVPFVVTDQANIGVSWSTWDATFSIEEVRDRYLKPAGIALANQIDLDGLTRVTPLVAHAVGTPGTTPTTYQLYIDAVTKLRNVGVPDGNLVSVISPNMSGTLVGQNATIFNPVGVISNNFEDGEFAQNTRALGISKWYWDQNTWTRTTGESTTFTPLVNQTTFTEGMTSIVTDGNASSATTYRVGDKFTIANVFEINPITKASTGQLMQLTVTQQVTSSGVDATINFAPALYTTASGSAANVDALPVNNAPIIPLGSTITTGSGTWTATVTRQGLVYHPEAFVLGIVPPDRELAGADVGFVSDSMTGWSARYVRQYNAQTDHKISRLDMFYGWLAYRPDWAVAIQGGAS